MCSYDCSPVKSSAMQACLEFIMKKKSSNIIFGFFVLTVIIISLTGKYTTKLFYSSPLYLSELNISMKTIREYHVNQLQCTLPSIAESDVDNYIKRQAHIYGHKVFIS